MARVKSVVLQREALPVEVETDGRGARVVDRDRLEICCALAGTVGSNPTLSANNEEGPDLWGLLHY